jgi:hypothetical protein
MLHNFRTRRITVPASALALLIAVSVCFVRPSLVSAQSTTSTDERLKALERERDELRKRNGVLELRLKQLQATVNDQVSKALQPSVGVDSATQPPTPHPPGEAPSSEPPSSPAINPYWMSSARSMGPPYSRFGGFFSPLQSPVDVVSLAVAYQDALAELRKARQAKDSKENRPSVELDSVERKVRLLRSITQTLRDELAGEVERLHKLAAIHAVPTMDVRNMDTKLRILDLILTQDPDAGPVSNEPTSEKPAKAN